MALDPRQAFERAMRKGAGRFAPRGLDYLCQVVAQAGPPAASREKGASGSMTPEDLCRRFTARAARDFGPLAAHVADRWGLADGASLGRAVFLLAETGCLAVEPDERWEDYATAGEFRFPG